MAAKSDQGWIGYGYNRRYNPQTGEVQYDLKGNGDWQTVSTLTKYDPNDPRNPQNYQINPNQVASGGNFLVNQGGWSLPTQNTIQQIYYAQQAAQQGQGGQQQQAQSYYGGGQPNWSGGWAGGASAGGAPATTSGTVGGGGQGGGGNTMAYTAASQLPAGVSLPSWQTWYGQNVGKTIMVGGQPRVIGQDIGPDEALSAYRSNSVGYNVPQQSSTQASQPQINQPQIQIGSQTQPETTALGQMAKIDPTSEALRQSVGQSYLNQLQGGGQPTNQQLQSYLNQFQQIDPQSYAAMQGLGGQYAGMAGQQQQDVDRMSQLAALGTQLDPETLREVTQSVRQGQSARGNVYGTPQLVQEAMTRGQAGMAIQQQREQMLQSALQGQQGGLGAYQGYLTSGATPGGLALNLYQQQQNQMRANQQGALGYLGSGQTPYQAGAGYVDRANAMAQTASQGGYQYNPSNLGGYYTGAGASSFPQYGLDTSQNAANWYNSINSANLQSYNLQNAYRPQGGNYGQIGSAAGGILGSVVGSVVPGIGTAVGGLAGSALGGAAGGMFSR